MIHYEFQFILVMLIFRNTILVTILCFYNLYSIHAILFMKKCEENKHFLDDTLKNQ